MFRRILLAAVAAGLLGGIAISVVQEFTTTPLILHAEQFENAASGKPAPVASVPPHPGDATTATAGWSPADGAERTIYTSLGNIVLGVGFALLLVAGYALYGKEVDGRQGVIWGVAGFAVFSLAPSLGLPPELPGSMAAELVDRQGWWLLSAGATALGLGLMVFGRGIAWVALGVIVLAAPHIAGAPRPETIGGAVPAELAGHFVAASLVTAAVFWTLLGWLSGTFYRRLS